MKKIIGLVLVVVTLVVVLAGQALAVSPIDPKVDPSFTYPATVPAAVEATAMGIGLRVEPIYLEKFTWIENTTKPGGKVEVEFEVKNYSPATTWDVYLDLVFKGWPEGVGLSSTWKMGEKSFGPGQLFLMEPGQSRKVRIIFTLPDYAGNLNLDIKVFRQLPEKA